VLATGGTRVGGTLPIGVDPALTTGAEGVSDSVEVLGVESRTDVVRTGCCGSLIAGASFVAVTGFDAAGGGVGCGRTRGATASVAVVATAAAAAASLTGVTPPLKNQPKSSAMEATAPRRDGFVSKRPSSAATERRARKIKVSTAATETPSSTPISSYESP